MNIFNMYVLQCILCASERTFSGYTALYKYKLLLSYSVPWVFRVRRKGDSLYLGCSGEEERVLVCTLGVTKAKKG